MVDQKTSEGSSPHMILALGAGLALLAVAAGAFGSHTLKARLSTDMLAVFETGVRYHMYHALALLVTGGMMVQSRLPMFCYAAWSFVLGICLFSGSLYLLSLSGHRWLGMVTPLGGVMFLAGWLLLIIGFVKTHRKA